MEWDGVVMPRPKIQSKVMETTPGFQHRVPKASFPTTDFIFNNAIPFDPADGMFEANPYSSQPRVGVLVQVGQRLTSG
jgi:hypothetical protein